MDITAYALTIQSIQNMMQLNMTKIKNKSDNPINQTQKLIKYLENLRIYYSKINNLNEIKICI